MQAAQLGGANHAAQQLGCATKRFTFSLMGKPDNNT